MPSRRNASVKAARASFLIAVEILPPRFEASIFCSKSDWRPDNVASGTSGLLPDKKILSGSKIVLSAGNGTVSAGKSSLSGVTASLFAGNRFVSAGKFVVSGDKVSDLTNLAAV